MFENFRGMVRKTEKGIIVNQPAGGTVKAMFYRDGNYPDVPTDPQGFYNDHVTNEAAWWHELENQRPDRVYDWID